MRSYRKFLLCCAGIGAAFCVWWFASSPPEVFSAQIKAAFLMPDNPRIAQVYDSNDLGAKVAVAIPEAPPFDEIVIKIPGRLAFAAAMDGWIWRIDLRAGTAQAYVRAPLLPAGMVLDPSDSNRIYFCVSRAQSDDNSARPGVYALDIDAKRIQKVADRVPRSPDPPIASHNPAPPDDRTAGARSNIGRVYPPGSGPRIALQSDETGNTGRAVEKCDDLAISSDGQRIYFTEPYDHPGAILGVSWQSFAEALTLGRNGRLYMLDLKRRSTELIADGYTYLDGVLLEYGDGAEVETAVIVGELSKARLLRLALRGADRGRDSILIDGLPGLPDGLDRDPQGRIWIALVKMRSGLLDALHARPAWKHLLLRLPYGLLPISKRTGLLVVSPDGRTPQYAARHSGDSFSNLIVVVPDRDRVYLAPYHPGQKVLLSMPYPQEL